MEENKQTRSTVFSWALIGVAFIVIISFLLIKFLNSGRDNAKVQSQERLTAYATNWSNQLRLEVELATDYGLVYSDMIAGGSEFASDDMVSSAKSMVERTGLSHVLFCDGDRLISDENKSSESFGDLSIFAGEEIQYFLIPDEESELNNSVCIYIPVNDSGKYVLCMLNLDIMSEGFASSSFEEASFLAIINSNGDVLATFSRYKDTNSTFLKEANFFKGIEQGSASEDYGLLRVKMNSGTPSSVASVLKGDSRTFSFAPIGLNDWCMVFGVREANVNKLVKSSYAEAKATVVKLIIVIVVFSIFAISMLVFNQLRSKERGRVLEDKADTDLLTDLNNKAATERKIQEYIDDNPDGRAMMFILDIDNFKKINDTMGHAFGDTLLKTLGKEIRTEFRMTDIIGRTGGDEFMVFLKGVTDDMIVEREANRITRFFHDFKAGGDYVKYSATASIGAAIYPDDAKSFKELYIAADQALYRAKKRGKNQLVFYNENTQK